MSHREYFEIRIAACVRGSRVQQKNFCRPIPIAALRGSLKSSRTGRSPNAARKGSGATGATPALLLDATAALEGPIQTKSKAVKDLGGGRRASPNEKLPAAILPFSRRAWRRGPQCFS
jgi:hypothetical protein